MKTLLLLSCILVAAAVASAQKEVVMVFAENMKESFDACAKETKMSLDEAINEAAKMTGSTPEKAGCFQACVMKHEGLMKDGKIDTALMKERVAAVFKDQPEHAGHAGDIAEECSSKSAGEADDCKTAFKASNCFFEKMHA